MKGFLIRENSFDDERIKLIETLPSGDETLIIYFRMLAVACKSDAGGFLILNRTIPYTDEMLAALFGRSLQVVRYALNTLIQFGMIEEAEDGFKVDEFQKWLMDDEQKKADNRKRVAKYREEQKNIPAPAEEKPKKKKRVYAESDVEMQLALYLFKKIRENNPEHKEPNFQVWADQVRLMIERDGRKPEQIKNMIDWCQADSFWKGNILSTKKLRDKYDQLKIRALAEMERASGGNVRTRVQENQSIFENLLGEGEE
ncbi:replisome organizer [Bacillus phage 022DV001]|nr:replisome organizer [Bacillus phage 022DV001]